MGGKREFGTERYLDLVRLLATFKNAIDVRLSHHAIKTFVGKKELKS